MKNKIKLIISTVIFALLIIFASIAYKKLAKSEKNEIEIQKKTEAADTKKIKAQDFTVLSETGEYVNFSDFEGKAVIVNFWASWCPPCRAELPDFDKLCKEYGDKVQFMMVNMTDGNMETVKSVTKFAKDNSWTFPLFFDTKQSAATAYKITSIPVTVFIKKDGFVNSMKIGMLSEKILQDEIKKIAE